ncbi:tumor necrosis factor a (TNF superfamily, member 2) [Sebastes umbrosus]|uniref:tumor necrosis factor a (TNF superfamily, member 2) n=1 Tax=Sebastes umbrosus TaxID=72105 RepID=UPI00189F3F10|nr:tumor necrosis factor a (TNF superfamily, member 2) [Sebastes umbrosus]
MEGECKVLLEVDTDTRKQRTPVTPGSKMTTALLVFTLCLASAAAAVLVLNRTNKGSGQDEVNSDLRHTLRQISGGKAAIHLEGEHNPARKTSVEWRDEVDQSHSKGDLKLINNEIVIPRNGLYFVYSQASFRVNCSSGDAEDAASQPLVHVSHTVKRWSSSFAINDDIESYKTILHSIRTACQMKASSDVDEAGGWYSTVYMGAVFNLDGGDKLRTVMEEKMLLSLEDDEGKTFFGVFAL